MLWYKHPAVPHLIPHHSSQDVVTHLKHLARTTAHKGLGDFHWSSLTVNRAKVKKGSNPANPAAYKLRSKKVWHLSVRIKCVSHPAVQPWGVSRKNQDSGREASKTFERISHHRNSKVHHTNQGNQANQSHLSEASVGSSLVPQDPTWAVF